MIKSFFKKFYKVCLFGIFASLFLIWNVHAVSYLDLWEEGTPSYWYQPENYNMILDTNWEYKLEKNGETKNLMYWWASVRWRPFLYYFWYYNDRLGVFQFMDDQPSYNINTVNRIWYNATIYNYTTQSWNFINWQWLPSANNCNWTKPDNDTWECYFKLRDDFWEEYNEKVDWMIWNNNNSSFMPCFIYEELNEIVCMDQRTQDSNNYAVYDTTNRYNFETFNDSMWIYPTFIVKSEGWDIITDTWSITNFEAILWYNYTYWFNDSYCYWGYPISDIFNSTDNPENFTWFELWSGAYIYDIYNAYSWSYFSSASQFYQSFYSRYLVNNIASFYNYPKALYWIIERYAWLYDHYQTYDPNIWISKLVSYCELYKLDPDALYTWGDISAENWYSNLIWEITDKWRYYDSGPLSILSWENIKFWSDDFFTNILNKINTSLDNVSNNSVWIIPSYILVVLVALILFRIMSH